MLQDTSERVPYAPSYIDRWMDLAVRLPGSYWLTYSVLFVLQNLVLHLVAWVVGWLPAYTFLPISSLFAFWLWGPMAIMTYLNSVSLAALSNFRPLLEIDAAALEGLKYEFRFMPARSVVVCSVIWAAVYLVGALSTFGAIFQAYNIGFGLGLIVALEGLVAFAAGGAIYYHSFRQLRLVNQTVRLARHFNLFRLDPVYAFSRVTSQTGIAWIILLSVTLLLFPGALRNDVALLVLALQVLLAIGAFVLPLWFVHGRLATEKHKLLAEHNRRVESTLAQLHHHLDQKEIDQVNQINPVMTALTAERAVLTTIPTWPWRSGTLTGFVSAIILPIMLFLFQLVVKKLMGGDAHSRGATCQRGRTTRSNWATGGPWENLSCSCVSIGASIADPELCVIYLCSGLASGRFM